MIARSTGAVMSPISAASRRPQVPAIIVGVAAVAAFYAWAVFALTPSHPGAVGLNLNALGTDWLVFYGGARQFFDGHLATLFDGDGFTAYLNATFAYWLTQPIPFRPWVYPPSYLLAMLPFGLLPLAASYVAFQLVTAALLAAALLFGAERRSERWLVAGAALLGPAAAINAGIGQNAFLTAALLVGGFRLVPRRPVLGGILLGLLTMKPQFWLLVPVALVAAREWRALCWSVAAALGLALAAAGVFGTGAWRHWFELARGSYGDANGEWVALGRMWGDSVYACLVAGGVPDGIANVTQGLATLLGIGLVYRAFSVDLPVDRKIAILLAATLLAAPHSSLADMVLLGVAAALCAGELLQQPITEPGALARWTLVLALWTAVLVNPPLVSPIGRLTPLLLVGFIAFALGGAGRVLPARSAPGLGRQPAGQPAPRG